MARDAQKYTRWTNDQNVDDDDDEETVHEPLEHGEDYEQMQEGRRVLAMMTPKNPDAGIGLSRPAFARLVCAMILVTALCLTFGALVGYIISNKSHSSIPAPVFISCPTPSPTRKITTSTTTNTTTSTTTRKPAVEPAVDPKLGFGQLGDIEAMANHIQSHLTPSLIRHYVRNISDTEPDQLKYYLSSTFESLGFTVKERVFPVVTSTADRENPNTVEVLMGNDTALIINNATESLNSSLPFTGFSPNGTATGPLVFAGYASEQDFQNLEEANVNISGCILLIKYGKVHPSFQVQKAELRGALAVILYPDLSDFGANSSNASYPEGSALPSDAVIWQSLKVIPGDPSTPNYASQRDIFRISQKKYPEVPSIPVQPVSPDTGGLLLDLLGGKKEALPGWRTEDNKVLVRVTVNNMMSEHSSHVLVAFLPSQDHSKVIHVGSHYEIKDSRLTSSGLGLASLVALGDALHRAYPNGTTRLLTLLAFEGKDGDFSAGNEFSQLFTWWLESTAMAYVDMDTVLEGSGFLEAAVSPILRETVREAFHHVAWVNGEGLNVNQGLTDTLPRRFSSSGDNTKQNFLESFKYSTPFECDESANFVNVHGIPSMQLTAVGVYKDHRFHLRDSQYDTMEALITLEDKDIHWTHMVVSVVSVAALILSSSLLPPVRFDEVGWDLKKAWNEFLQEERSIINGSHPAIHGLTVRITSAIDSFILTCESYDTGYKDGLDLDNDLSSYQKFRKVEERLQFFTKFGRRFLRPRNIPRHSDFGSLVTYGPSIEDPCEGTHFPVIRKAMKEAAKGRESWDILLEELSLLLSSLVDIRMES